MLQLLFHSYNWLIDRLLFNVPLENISLREEVTIVGEWLEILTLFSTYGLLAWRVFIMQYGASGFTVSFEGPPKFSRLLGQWRGTKGLY